MKNWEIKNLGEVIEIRNGKNQQGVLSETGRYKIMGSAGNVMGYATDFICEAGTTIIGRKGNISKPIYIDEKFWIVDTAFGFYPKYENEIDKRLVYYLCLGIDFKSMNRGTTIPSLVKSELQVITIKYPKSLPEQQRIVTILDKAFAAIAKAKTNAEQNLKNAKELFDVHLHKYYTNKERGWEEKKLKEVAEYFNGLTYSPKDVSDEGIIVLRSSNIQNDELDFKDIVRVKLTVKEKIIVKEGDILMCSRNGSARLVGKTATIKKLNEEMTFGTFMMIVRSKYNPYLSWYFKSTDFRNQIKVGENTMINQITRYMLDDVIISFPPIEIQDHVVKELNVLAKKIKKLEAIYTQKINDLEELKKSLLQKAFSGELTANEVLV